MERKDNKNTVAFKKRIRKKERIRKK